jgi:WD40 repeat protein
MQTKINPNHHAARDLFWVAVCVGAVLLISPSVQAQNLFVAGVGTGPYNSSGYIAQITPGGAKSTFASGLTPPFGLAFDNAGNLFVSEYNSQNGAGYIVEYTSGTWRVFASMFSRHNGLAFNSAGYLFEADTDGNIYSFTPGGMRSTFASGLNEPTALAFNSAGDLFAADNSGNIYNITQGKRTFASGLSHPEGLAFNSAGDLFVAAGGGSSVIYEFTPDGAQSTFASGLFYAYGLAFNSAGDLFVAASDSIIEITPDGAQSTFASGLHQALGVAFQPVPEPSALGLLAVGITALLVRRHRNLAA